MPLRLGQSHTSSVPIDELDSDTDNCSSPSSPASLTSSVHAPTPSLSSELEQEQETPLAPRSPSPPRVSIEIAPSSQSCPSCGASVIARHPSTTTLYTLTIPMPSATNSDIQVRVAAQPPYKAAKVTSALGSAPNQSIGRGKKRKAATDDDADNADEIAFSSLAPPAKVGRRQGAAVLSTAMSLQTPHTTKKVIFAPEPIASKTGINASTLVDNFLQFSEDDDTNGREGSPEQELPLPVSHITFPAPTSQGSPGPSTPSSSSLQEEDNATEAEDASLSELQDEKRRLLQALWESERTLSQLRAQSNESRESSELIPRPPGEKGKNGWNMQEALRLKDNGDLYNEILATTRTAVSDAGLDCTLKFRAQDLEKLIDCYDWMKLKHSYLAQFECNWACRELVKNALQNRRKAESMRQRGVLVKKSANSIKAPKRKGYSPRSNVPPEEPEGPESAADGNWRLETDGDDIY